MPAPPQILDQYALTTVEAVMAAGSGIDAEDQGFRDNIVGEINAVSRRVYKMYQVEIKMPVGQVTAFDGAMTAGSPVLTSATANFVVGDVGKLVVVYGAGNLGFIGKLETTILSRQSATQVTLAANAANTVSGAQYVYGAVARVVEMTGDGYGNGWINFAPGVAQTVSGVLLDTQGGQAGTALDPAAFDYQVEPLGEQAGVYNALRVYSWGAAQFSLATPWGINRQATVTGLWGYPVVPPDIELAVIGQVIDNLNNSYRIVSNTPIPGDSFEPSTPNRRSGMNAQLRSTMDQYKYWTVAG
jgi:hypothetical protein